ncbi:HRDC domain-containing protein [Candidatus Woesearchaeota archaeon]|nr:HRDC domain-containing protein [Candidatus Woesearchaeota archaeon]
MVQFSLIQTPDKLMEAVELWEKEPEIAFDLECENNLHHYGTYITLLQVSTRTQNWIIDVLAFKTIDPLIHVLENKNVLKVLHDVSFDLRILHHQFQCRPKNLFDTQLAAMLLGKEKVGLGALLEEYFQVQKERKYQRVDWTKRPLSLGMLEYAAGDTAHLLPLKDAFEREFRQKQRERWMREEREHQEMQEFRYEEQQYLDLPGAKRCPPGERARLHVLFDERQRLAMKADKPVFFIMSNKLLLEFAKNPPRDWRLVHGVHPLVRREAQVIQQKVDDAGREEYISEEKKRLTPEEFVWTEDLAALRKSISLAAGIPGHLVMNNDQIWQFVETKSLDGFRPWQREIVLQYDLVRKIVGRKTSS